MVFSWLVAVLSALFFILIGAAALSGSLGWSVGLSAGLSAAAAVGVFEISRRLAKLSKKRALMTGVLSSVLLIGASAGVFVLADLDSEAVVVAFEDLRGKERLAAAEIKPAGAMITGACEWRDSLPAGGLDEPVFPVVDGWTASMPEHVDASDTEQTWSMTYRGGGKTVRVQAITGGVFGADFFEKKYAYQRAQVQGLDNHCVLLPQRQSQDAVVWRSGKWLVVASSSSFRAGDPAVGVIAPALLRVFPSDLPRPPAE
jgi:hypothetical protein